MFTEMAPFLKGNPKSMVLLAVALAPGQENADPPHLRVTVIPKPDDDEDLKLVSSVTFEGTPAELDAPGIDFTPAEEPDKGTVNEQIKKSAAENKEPEKPAAAPKKSVTTYPKKPAAPATTAAKPAAPAPAAPAAPAPAPAPAPVAAAPAVTAPAAEAPVRKKPGPKPKAPAAPAAAPVATAPAPQPTPPPAPPAPKQPSAAELRQQQIAALQAQLAALQGGAPKSGELPLGGG